MFIVLDVDGTLADNTHRRHLLLGKQAIDWERFFAPDLVMKDTAVPGAVSGVARLQELKHDILIITARHEALRDTTMRWLLENFELDLPDSHLLMRPQGNMLKAAEYKREQLINFKQGLENRDTGFIVIDDDKEVSATMRTLAIVLKAPECWDILFPL